MCAIAPGFLHTYQQWETAPQISYEEKRIGKSQLCLKIIANTCLVECFISRMDSRRIQNGNIVRFRSLPENSTSIAAADVVLTLYETNREEVGEFRK